MLKRHEEAVLFAQKAVNLDPEYDLAYNNLGLAHRELGHHGAAVEAFSKAVRLNPKNLLARYNLGNLLLSSQDFSRAENEFLVLTNLEPERQDG